jgi:hypothetical protein
MVCATTGLKGDLDGRQLPEEANHLCGTEIETQRRTLCLVDAMQREHGFGRVDANVFKLGYGRLRSWLFTATNSGTRCRGAVHPNNDRNSELSAFA